MFDEKYQHLLFCRKGIDSRVDEILESPQGELADKIRRCGLLNKNNMKRGYIEASFLCEPDVKVISDMVGISVELLEVYYEFFFDLTDVDRLSKMDHINNLKDKNEALLKMWALSNGIDFLRWRLGYRVSISPVEGLVDLFSTCIYKSKEAMFTGSASEAGKESAKWTKLSTDIARLLKMWVMDSGAARKDLEIAIREVVPDFDGIDSLFNSDEKIINEMSKEIEILSLKDLQADD